MTGVETFITSLFAAGATGGAAAGTAAAGTAAAGAAGMTAATKAALVGAGASLATGLASNVMQMKAMRRAANMEADRLRMLAEQKKVEAGQKFAAAQRAGLERRRQTNLALSSLRAKTAGSGGFLDPSFSKLAAGIISEGEYRYKSALFEGENALRSGAAAAAGLNYNASSAVSAAKLRSDAAKVGMVGDFVSGVSGMARTYYSNNPLGNNYIDWNDGTRKYYRNKI